MMKRVVAFTLAFLLPVSSIATAYSIGKLSEWRPMIGYALKYIEVEYDEGVESMIVEERVAATYVIAYVEGIREGGIFYQELAHSNKYGEETPFESGHEIDMGYCIEDPYFEIIPKLDAHIAKSNYSDDVEFLHVLMRFLMAEYSCE